DWTASDIQRMQLTLRDARGTEVFKSTVAVSAHSSFAFEYAIPDAAPTGVWTLMATDVLAPDTALARPVQNTGEGYEGEDGEERPPAPRGQPKVVIEESFRVEAFKPASFEVHVTPEKPFYFGNDTFKAVIDGWYLFGAPMTEADVDWKLRLNPSG